MSRIFLIFLVTFAYDTLGQKYPSVEKEHTETDGIQEGSRHDLVAPEALKTTRLYQEEDVRLRKFDEGRWKAIIGDRDYSEKSVEKDKSKPFSLAWAAPLLKVIFYVVIIGFVVFLLYYVAKNITFDLRIERHKLRTEDREKPLENIDSLDIDALLEQARRDGNFRMAIRLYYLGLLKKLNAAGMIVWKKDKTNRDYLSELFLKNFDYRKMQRLTLSYEAVWYGEHTLKAESLEALSKEFERVYREINTDKAV